MMKKEKIGIVGCGNISTIYLKNCTSLFNVLEVVAVSDLVRERAAAQAQAFGIGKVLSLDALLGDPEITTVLNLTVPGAHYDICLRALQSGKNVYVEKPLSLSFEQGRTLVRYAKDHGLRIGCAPDTFLGAGIQTCVKLIDSGVIGEPVGATAFMLSGGWESWHPDPEFYYRAGGGPMFDMGPYYLTALVALLGPVKTLSGATRMTWSERTITSRPKKGTVMNVEVPTHVSALLEFASGVQGVIVTSFDVKAGSGHVPLEIHGSLGTLCVPDPNTFGGPIRLKRPGAKEWEELPLQSPYDGNSRGLGLADMAVAIARAATHRANGNLALHVLEIMEGIHVSAESGRRYAVTEICPKPEVLVPTDLEG